MPGSRSDFLTRGPNGPALGLRQVRAWWARCRSLLLVGYGLTKTKFLVLSGQIRSVKDGRYRRILPEWVDDYIRRLAKEQAA